MKMFILSIGVKAQRTSLKVKEHMSGITAAALSLAMSSEKCSSNKQTNKERLLKKQNIRREK